MKTGELVLSLRSELGVMNSEIISDAELIRYLDEAYKMHFRLIGGVTDIDSTVTELDVVAADYDVPLHTAILRINKAVRRSDGGEVKVVGYADVVGVDGTAKLLRETGRVQYMVMGIKPHYARWAPIPSEDDIVDLIVERTPLRSLTSSTDSLTDLDEVHHFSLLDWAKSRIYQRPGTSFFSLPMASAFEAKFRDYCAVVRREKERFKSKVHIVAYGGI